MLGGRLRLLAWRVLGRLEALEGFGGRGGLSTESEAEVSLGAAGLVRKVANLHRRDGCGQCGPEPQPAPSCWTGRQEDSAGSGSESCGVCNV